MAQDREFDRTEACRGGASEKPEDATPPPMPWHAWHGTLRAYFWRVYAPVERPCRRWIAGRKTYLLSGVLLLMLLGLLFTGRLTPATAIDLLPFALAGFAATFRSALDRHHDEVLEVLGEIALAGVAQVAHQETTVIAELGAAAKTSCKLSREIRAEQKEGAGA